jgi:hypothetical protein
VVRLTCIGGFSTGRGSIPVSRIVPSLRGFDDFTSRHPCVRHRAKHGVQCADSERLVRWDGDTVMCWIGCFQNDVASQPGARGRTSPPTRGHRPTAHQRRREAASRDRQDLIADKMKANVDRRASVEIERIHSFADVPAEPVPRIGLCEDAFGR